MGKKSDLGSALKPQSKAEPIVNQDEGTILIRKLDDAMLR